MPSKCAADILLVVGEDATVDLSLQVGKVSQQVKVVADVPIVNATTQDISGLVGEKEVKALPLNGRSYDLLLALNPGIVNFTWEKTGGIGVSNSTTGNNFSVSGNRPQQNLFLLNGVEFTGAAENNMQPGGPSENLLGVEAVREFNVLRDSYGAEYGKRPGAQVTIVTQSGSNQWHGSVYEFLRNNALDAPNYFDQGSAPPFQRNQFGAALGGPIQKDKTFFFANFEGFIQNLHQTSVAFVPDLASRAAAVPSVKPLLNLWPTPTPSDPDFNGIAQVSSSPLQTIREYFGNARLDHVFSAQDTFSAVYTIDDGHDFTPTTLNPYSTDRADAARAGGHAGGDARLLANAVEYRPLRLFAGGVLLHRGTDTGDSGGQCSRFSGGRPGGRGGGGRKCRLQSPGADWPGGKQQRQQPDHGPQSVHL